MESKHTPGPWNRTKYPNIVYESKKGQGIADCYIRPGISKAQARANARLIAAAPDLLETLEEVLPFISNPIYPFHENAMVAQAEKAIAKAKGKK